MLTDPKRDPVIGSLLDGRYLVSSLLGQGGMGNVYLAEETRLRRRCALKVLHPALAQDRTHVARFLREAQMIAQLEHPNIVDIYAYGEEASGVVWFAMELLPGEDLDVRVRARALRPFTTQDCCAWGVQIARAVAVVHDAGLIHRDLKTSNIFLTRRRDGSEVVKLLDFGIARPEQGSELTTTGVTLGTPSYMSPEQVRNLTVDRRSDVYSFGVLLFKLLTNRLPFSGDAIQVAVAHCTEPPPVPSDIAAELDISPELDALVLRTMAKEPSERYQSMHELVEALAAILRVEAPELATAERPARASPAAGSRPDGKASLAVLPVTVAPLPPYAADAGTDASTVHATGPTTIVPRLGPARPGKWLYITTGASILGVVLLLAVVMVGGKDDPGTQPTAVTGLARVGRLPASALVEQVEREPVAAVRAPVVAESPTAIAVPVEPLPVEPLPVEPPQVPASELVAPKPRPKPTVATGDPRQQIERKAKVCRRKHNAVGGPTVTIDYAVGMDGKVVRSIPSRADELGQCLAAVVQGTTFAPKTALGQKIVL